jgi:hypothetical protein
MYLLKSALKWHAQFGNVRTCLDCAHFCASTCFASTCLQNQANVCVLCLGGLVGPHPSTSHPPAPHPRPNKNETIRQIKKTNSGARCLRDAYLRDVLCDVAHRRVASRKRRVKRRVSIRNTAPSLPILLLISTHNIPFSLDFWIPPHTHQGMPSALLFLSSTVLSPLSTPTPLPPTPLSSFAKRQYYFARKQHLCP